MRLTIGCTFSDRIEALLDGRVAIDGFAADLRIVEAQRLFREVLQAQAYDVAELSMGSHIVAVAAGRRDYVGVPVFLSRSFRHANLYVRTDRGIDTPEDLAGKRIGLADFQQTAALWLRGLLADEHGVARESVHWTTAGLHAPVLTDRMAMELPPGIRVERSPSTLDALLRTGAIDAIISPTAPKCFADDTVPVARLWGDPRAAERDWWQRHHIFPIMHVLVVRRALVEANPELPAVLYAAFEQARALAATDVANRDFPKLVLPWLSAFAAEAHAALSGDPWTYGVAANRDVLTTMLRYAVADGLAPASLRVEDLFA
jgi:4,5-dihydroxyphthalate decarboxylase